MRDMKNTRTFSGRKSKIKYKILVLAEALVLLLSSCGNNDRNAQVQAFSDKYAVPQDNQLIVYTSHKKEVYLPIIREFENQTGIWVDIHAGGTAEMMQAAEEAAENGQCDIMFGGGVESYEASKDLFLPYEAADLDKLDAEYIDDENLWTPFTELPIVFVYNKNLVAPSAVPRSFEDIYDEKWKGKIAFADIESSGTSYTIISTMAQLFNEKPEDTVEKFYKQLDGNILASSGQVISEVSNGNYLVGITLEETALKEIDAGSNIVMVIPDKTSAVPDGVAIIKNAPHSYNAGRFIDFVVNYDTQSYAMDSFYRRPVRTDIYSSRNFDSIELVDFDIAKSAAEEDKTFSKWRSLRGAADE